MPIPATPIATTTAGSIIQSVRDQIPDRVTNLASDGDTFTLSSLVNWINDAMREIAIASRCVLDFYAIQSSSSQDVYELPTTLLQVEQLWYDLKPCTRSAALDDFFTTFISGNSWFFDPAFTVGSIPRMHLWPAPSRTGATGTLSATLTATATAISATADIAAIMKYGYIGIENEIIRYTSFNHTTFAFGGVLRAQAGTIAAAHTAPVTITELNIWFKCSKLPTPITGPGDPIQIPNALVPLIELYVLSKCREAEQEAQLAHAMRQEFAQAITTLAQNSAIKGLRQGIQVRNQTEGPLLYGGRLYVP